MRPSQDGPIIRLAAAFSGSTRAPVARPFAFLNGIR